MLKEFFCDGSCGQRLWAWSGLVVFLAHQASKPTWHGPSTHGTNGFTICCSRRRTTRPAQGESDPNALPRHRVYQSLVEFGILVAPAVVVHPLAGLLRNWWVFSWRRVLMKSYLHRWNTSIPAIEGASQRVHEDTQRFASGIQSCVAVVLQSIFTLAVFCPVLYALDPSLMAIAVCAALGGLAVSMIVGWPLVGLEVKNQCVEAELRKRLVLLKQTRAACTPTAPRYPVYSCVPLADAQLPQPLPELCRTGHLAGPLRASRGHPAVFARGPAACLPSDPRTS